MIKIDDITEIEIKDGILTITQFDNNEVILSQDDLKKILEAINYTPCREELQAVEDLIEFARNNCREWNNDEMEEIIDRL